MVIVLHLPGEHFLNLSSFIKPKHVDEVLMEVTVRNVRVGRMKEKFCRRIDMFE